MGSGTRAVIIIIFIVVGIIVVAIGFNTRNRMLNALDRIADQKDEKNKSSDNRNNTVSNSDNSQNSQLAELTKYKNLYESGQISADEYNETVRKILNS